MAGSLVFAASYVFYIFVYLKSGAPVIYPLYLVPFVIIFFICAYSFMLSRLEGKSFSKIFSGLLNTTGVFALLFLTPLFIKANLPDPHNFIQRKLEIMLGASYAVFICLLTVYFLFRLNRDLRDKDLKTKQIFIFLFVFLSVFYFAVSLWFNYANQPTGDEPSYLIVAHSIVFDRDLDLKNNYEGRDYSRFYNKDLVPQEIEVNGRLYSYHPVLLSVLIAPFYLIAGRLGVTIFINMLTALFAALIFVYLAGIYKDRKIPVITALIAAFSLPLFVFSNQICCEVLSGVLITGALVLFAGNKEKFLIACAVSALIPWAHPRNFPLWAALGFIVLYEHRKEIKNMMIFAGTQALSAALLLWFNYSHYHSLIPRQTHNEIPISQIFEPFKLKGIFGLFFDQEFGIFIYTPLLIFIFAGAIRLFKSNKKIFWQAMLMFVPYYVLIASWIDWRGGGGSSPRFFVPVAFIFFLFIAEVLDNLRSKITLLTVKIFAAAGFFMSLCMFMVPWFRWSKGLGENWILKFISGIFKANLAVIFPSFYSGNNNVVRILAWVIITAGLNYYIMKVDKAQ